MRNVKRIAALGALLLAASCGEPSNGPAAFVRGVYAPYIADAQGDMGLLVDENITASLKSVIDNADAYSRLIDAPVYDYDPVIDGQDEAIKSVDVVVTSPPKDGAAIVEAKFDNMGATSTVLYDLRQEDGVWKIDNIRSDGANFRQQIVDNLKPIGDPATMEAPVRAIYARYAAEARPEPLHRWAAFSKGLRPLMEMQSAMGRRADTPVLDFDPALSGKDNQLGQIAYEAVSGAVIVRFQNAGQTKIVVYDLVEEDGVWKIANIRAPGDWDLLQKLAEAGVKE
jgi:hypothetical protein